MNKCAQCIWGAQCFNEGSCSDFCPTEQDGDEFIEEARKEFLDEWITYIHNENE